MEASNYPAQVLSTHYEGLGDASGDFRNSNLIRLITSYIQRGSVLDIGSGSGLLLSALVRKGVSATGLEPHPKLASLSKIHCKEAPVIAGKVEDIERLVPGTFEYVTMIDVLEHVEDDTVTLEKIAEKLKTGGTFVVVVPGHPSLFGLRDRAMGHWRRYSRTELCSRLEKQGFIIRTMRSWNALGVLPYWVSERVFHKQLNLSSRTGTGNPRSFAERVLRWFLNAWFRYVENRFSLGVGLSLICVAEKQ